MPAAGDQNSDEGPAPDETKARPGPGRDEGLAPDETRAEGVGVSSSGPETHADSHV